MKTGPCRLIGALLLAGSALAPLHADPLHADPLPSDPLPSDSLAEGFRDPPASAHPRVWWHWMNGNVTEEGIKLDLEWMKHIGIGGVQNFDAHLQSPQVVEKPLVYMTPEWKHAFRFAAETADRLGLEMAIAASPGWSKSGGSWVKPEGGIKKLVWSETAIPGGKRFTGKLAAPPTITGPFQDLGMQPEIGSDHPKTDLPQLHRYTYVLAYREAEAPLTPAFSASSGQIDGKLLGDGKQATVVHIPADTAEAPGWLRADFAAPQVVRSATLGTTPRTLFGAASFEPVLEASAGSRKRPVLRPTSTTTASPHPMAPALLQTT